MHSYTLLSERVCWLPIGLTVLTSVLTMPIELILEVLSVNHTRERYEAWKSMQAIPAIGLSGHSQ